MKKCFFEVVRKIRLIEDGPGGQKQKTKKDNKGGFNCQVL